MPFDVLSTKITDIKPTMVGGIICIDSSEVNFKYNIVYNVVSSTSAACFYVTNSKINIENSCFTRCSGKSKDEVFGNIGDIQKSNVKIKEMSSYLCSFSLTQYADSVLRFSSCGATITNFNTSYSHGAYGAASFRTESNTSAFNVCFMTCSSCIEWGFLEAYNIVFIEKSSFINSTQVTTLIVRAPAGTVFNSCYFFQMTTKTKFDGKVTLINCCSDETISGYSLTVYSSVNDVVLPILKQPLCKGKFICSLNKYPKKHVNTLYLITTLLTS